MTLSLYVESLADDEGRAREGERLGLFQLAELLTAAEQLGPRSRTAIVALASFNAVWSSLLEDLAGPENYLPADVRAKLISIGMFLLKEADAIQKERSCNFAVLRDVTATIAAGLA